MIQLDFFEAHDDISELKRQDEFLLERVDNLRRGLFKRHDVHQKSINTLLTMQVKGEEDMQAVKHELEALKKEIELLRKMLSKENK